MAETFEHNGTLYESLPGGQARVLGPAGGSSGPVYGAPAKVEPFAGEDQQFQREANARAAEAASRAQEQARRAELEWNATHNPDGSPKPKAESASTDPKVVSKMAAMDSLVGQIERVDELYRNGFKDEALGVISSLGEFLPTDAAAQLNAAGAGLAEQGLAAFRVPGVGAQSDTELRQFVEANRPSSWDRDVAIEEKLRQLRARVDATRSAMGLPPAPWGQAKPEAEAETPAFGGDGRVVLKDSGASFERAGQTQQIDDPQLTGLKGEYLRRLDAGQSATQLIAWMKKAGVPMTPPMMKSVGAQAKFRRENPNVPVTHYNIDAFDDVFQPTSDYQRKVGDAAQSAPGAFLMHSADAISANNLDSIVGATGGNTEQTRIALADSSRSSPTASFLGEVAGGASAALTGEAALARAGMAGGAGRAILADTAYGAAAGAGNADGGNRLSGAVQGAAFGAGGNIAGRAVTKGIASTVSPTGGKMAGLYEEGVRPTPGQRAANSGVAGRMLNGAEEALQSVPIVGHAIGGARQEARDQFQVGAFNQTLREIGLKLPKGVGSGTQAHAFTQRAFDAAYNKARQGLRVVGDQEMASQVQELGSQIGMLAEPSANRFYTILKNVVMRRIGDGGQELSGAAYKDTQKDIGRIVRGIRKNQSGDGELADALTDLQHILDDAARRHSDPEAVKLLDAADRGYAKLVRIEDASARGGVSKDAGTFSPNDLASAVKKGDTRIRSKAYNEGEALLQEYADAGKQLSDRMPNSGTADRMAVGGLAAGGAVYLEPTTLSILGGLAGAYAPGARKVLKGAMAPRGPKAAAVAEEIRKRARLGSSVASAGALGTLPDQ